MSAAFDLVVAGAGPGGLAAAATAAEAGMKVCLIDDNPAPGGQIWRSSVGKGPAAAAGAWLSRALNRQVDVRAGWRASLDASVDGAPQKALRVECNGRYDDIAFGALIIATGARERFLPFPGWTLPGVVGAGGLQAFQKSGLDVAKKRIVVAGTGPLLLAVAANLRKAGAHITAVIEQAPMGRLAGFGTGLAMRHPGKLVEGARFGAKLFGVPCRTGAWVSRATGETRLRSVTVASARGSKEFETDYLAIGYHLVANTELGQLFDCRIEDGYLKVDELQQTQVEGIYGVGEVTGIGGADKALVEGRIAGLAAAGRAAEAKALFEERDRWLRFARRLDTCFELREELRALADEETIVCRCEDVAYKQLLSCRTWREAKIHTRCGMGPCQGRICGPATEFLMGWTAPAPRPPLFPVEIAALSEPPTPLTESRASAPASAHSS